MLVAIHSRTTGFSAASRAAVADSALRRKLEDAAARHLNQVAQSSAQFPRFGAERELARHVKEEAMAHLDELLIELKSRLEEHGCRVFFATDAQQAREYIVSLAKRNGLRRAVKSKSMTAEEIELNRALMEAGLEVSETDLGEFIVQLRGEKPSHITTPAIHLSRQDIGTLFAERLKIPYTAEPEQLTAAARRHLRPIFLGADLGVCGVNFAIAETGTLVIVENEGNARLSTTIPGTLVALMGLEKVIPKLSDLSHFLEILARTGTGQKLTSYTNFISGPRRAGELDGPRELHLVILDNGRSAMLADPVMREALYCIRCGACLNVCPVYRRVGGHAYGFTYPGPIGSVVSPTLFGDAAAELPFASTLCGACRDICPVKIDIPRLLLHLRWKQTARQSAVELPRAVARGRTGVMRFARAARHPWLIRALGRLASVMLRPLARDSYIRHMPPPFNAWTAARDFPWPRPRPARKVSSGTRRT